MSTPDDAILPFRLGRSNMRGRVVRLDDALRTILEQHRYPDPVSALISEAVLLTSLIGHDIKSDWKFSLQIRGGGPVGLIATDYFAPEEDGAPARLRAYARFDRGEVASTRATPFELLGQGVFGVIIDQGQGTTPYQGLTPLSGGTLSACAETYFAQSEQLATRFVSLSGQAQVPAASPLWRAAGMMIQQMPTSGGTIPDAPSGEDGLMSADDVAAMGDRGEDWNRVNMLMQTVEAHELIGPHLIPEVTIEDSLLGFPTGLISESMDRTGIGGSTWEQRFHYEMTLTALRYVRLRSAVEMAHRRADCWLCRRSTTAPVAAMRHDWRMWGCRSFVTG